MGAIRSTRVSTLHPLNTSGSDAMVCARLALSAAACACMVPYALRRSRLFQEGGRQYVPPSQRIHFPHDSSREFVSLSSHVPTLISLTRFLPSPGPPCKSERAAETRAQLSRGVRLSQHTDVAGTRRNKRLLALSAVVASLPAPAPRNGKRAP